VEKPVLLSGTMGECVEKPVLLSGTTGEYVEQLHQALTEEGYSCGEDEHSVPAVFGPETEAEVKLFQAGHAGSDGRPLTVDGVVGPDTWWALQHPSGDQQSGLAALPDMPVQEPTNVVAAAALASAWEELRQGVREVPDGSNRGPRVDLYTGVTGDGDGPPWCAYFVSWNFARAPGGSPFGKTGGALAIARYCERNVPTCATDTQSPSYSSKLPPRPGDVGVIDDGGGRGHALHVVAVLGDVLWSVEGNSGNAVRTRRRPVASVRWFLNFDAYAAARGLK